VASEIMVRFHAVVPIYLDCYASDHKACVAQRQRRRLQTPISVSSNLTARTNRLSSPIGRGGGLRNRAI
jgi:hypothetical protein